MSSPIIILLLVLWVVGLATSHTMGGLIHVLPCLAAALFVVRVLRRRRADRALATARDRKRKLMLRREGRY